MSEEKGKISDRQNDEDTFSPDDIKDGSAAPYDTSVGSSAFAEGNSLTDDAFPEDSVPAGEQSEPMRFIRSDDTAGSAYNEACPVQSDLPSPSSAQPYADGTASQDAPYTDGFWSDDTVPFVAPDTAAPLEDSEAADTDAQQLPIYVPGTENGGIDDLLFPPFSAPGRKKRFYVIKTILWIMSVIIVSLAVFFIFRMIERSQPIPEKKDNEKIPYNRYTSRNYTEESSIPGAPQVSADPDGPQISTSESSEEVSENTVNGAYKKASPSVVCITSYKGGEDYVLDKIGEGSGIVISADGYIATNSHVVDDNITTGVLITLSDGSQYLGTIIGVDPKTDLAVLKIDAKKLTPAEFADSGELFVGQEVYAIGNPGGSNFSNSLTRGTVSALNRILSTNGYVRYIQTDAAINPGNSGGPLINERGQVIGMNTAKIVNTKYEGMGFSIPSNKVAEIINKLIKYGYVNDRGTLSIEGTTCNLYESKLKNVPEGMVITAINSNSPIKGKNVKVKDIITELNHVRVRSAVEFIDELSKYKPGEDVVLTFFRAAGDGERRSYSFEETVTLIPDNI